MPQQSPTISAEGGSLPQTAAGNHPVKPGAAAGNGSPLIDRVVKNGEALARAQRLPAVELSSRALSDLLLIANGGFTPLTDFMKEEEARSVVEPLSLPDG